MLTVLLLLYAFRYYGIAAAPFALRDPSSYDTTVFIRDDSSATSSGRTVWDILWSCLATTFAVTWVSVHPNVPFLEESNWSILKRRLFLMVLALLAPEVMIMWAFKQWRGAVMIKEMVNKAKPESVPKWTTKHGYYLQMGGFKVVYTEEEKREEEVRSRRTYLNQSYGYRSGLGNNVLWRRVVHFREFRWLLEEHKIDFPSTTVEEIDDRSKGDALSKGIALLQITWFILQLIARHTQGLAVTELELTTAALAGVNSVMYLFWWNKPLDVRCPIIIHTKEIHKALVKKLYERELLEKQLAMDKLTDEERVELELKAAEKLEGSRSVEDHDWSLGGPDDFWLNAYLQIRLDQMTFGLFSPAANLCKSGWAVVVALFRPLLSLFPRCGSIVRYLWTSTAVLCQSGWAIVEHFFLSLLAFPLRYVRAVGHERPEELGKSQPSTIASVYPADDEIKGSAIAENSQSTPPDAVNGNDVAPTRQHNEVKSHPTKQWFENIIIIMKTITKKLILVPRILMFMPMDAILQPWSRCSLESYRDARGKIQNKSSLKLLFNEDDMDWIMSMIFYCERADSKPLLYFSAIAGAAFGSIHCAAWNFAFPSLVEKIMWRTASLTLVGVCLSIFPGSLIQSWAYPYWEETAGGSREESIWGLFGLPRNVSFLPSIIYPVSRLTILILALSSLRGLHAMDSVLQTVEWTKFIPHI